MSAIQWHDLGPVEQFAGPSLQTVRIGRTPIALVCKDGVFSALSGVCNHAGGPLGDGRLDGDFVVCPWHNWKYHCRGGQGEPGYESDAVPRYDTKVENGRLFVSASPVTKRTHAVHPPHPLSREVRRDAGPIRVVGISTTVMDKSNPRYSTSDALLKVALDFAACEIGCEVRAIDLNELSFRACEGYYSKSAHACTWPCSITQMDPADQLDRAYEAFVHWADVILVATPIRWGGASSLYFKMVERMNCIQNQMTIANKVLMRNKVAAFIITGGQDNVQAVAGQMLCFFGELGCHFPQFPFIAHSRGWSAEDMERNIEYVSRSKELREGAEQLVRRAASLAETLLAGDASLKKPVPGGRKAHQLDVKAQV